MEHCKDVLLLLAATLQIYWSRYSAIEIWVDCDVPGQDETRLFLNAIWAIAREVIRPSLTRPTISLESEVVRLTPPCSKRSFSKRIMAFITRGRVHFGLQQWDDSAWRWVGNLGD